MVWHFPNEMTEIVFTISGLWLIHSLSSRGRLPLALDLYSGSARLKTLSRRRLSWLGLCFVFLISSKWMNFMDHRKCSHCCRIRQLLSGFYNRDGVCLLRGTKWIIIIHDLFLLLSGFYRLCARPFKFIIRNKQIIRRCGTCEVGRASLNNPKVDGEKMFPLIGRTASILSKRRSER
jgi:hypothetical protein